MCWISLFRARTRYGDTYVGCFIHIYQFQYISRATERKMKTTIFFVPLYPDGVKPLPGSHRGRRSTARRSHEKEQHCHQEISSSDGQQQVPAVSAGVSGEDGEVGVVENYIRDNYIVINQQKNKKPCSFCCRCNPFFVRCIKPNNMKVGVLTHTHLSTEKMQTCFLHSSLFCFCFFSKLLRLRTSWSAVSWGTRASWRPSASAKRAILSGCTSTSSSSGVPHDANETKNQTSTVM